MSDAAVANFAAPSSGATPKKGKKRVSASKAKKAASHPTYRDMIVKAIQALKEHKGSSRQAILKYIMANYSVGHDLVQVNAHLKLALKRMAKDGALKQSKGQGASGSFRIGEKKPARVAKKAKVAKKPRAKKAAKKSTKAKAAAAGGEGAAAAGEAPKKKKRVSKSKKPKKAGSPKKAKKPKVARKPKSPKKAKSPKKKRSPKKAKATKASK